MMGSRDIIDIVSKVMAPINRRVRITVSRAIINLVNDELKCQEAQVGILADEVQDNVERFQEYGFTSVPDVGTEAIVVAVGGERAHSVVIATEDRRVRPKGLKTGECAVYTKQNGKRVYCKDDGKLELGTAPTKYVALAPDVKAEIEKLRAYLVIFNTTIFGSTINEPGAGSPSALQVALQSALTAYAASVPPIVEPAATEVLAK